MGFENMNFSAIKNLANKNKKEAKKKQENQQDVTNTKKDEEISKDVKEIFNEKKLKTSGRRGRSSNRFFK